MHICISPGALCKLQRIVYITSSSISFRVNFSKVILEKAMVNDFATWGFVSQLNSIQMVRILVIIFGVFQTSKIYMLSTMANLYEIDKSIH